MGIAVDAAGNAYVADNGNQTIRKVTPAGVVTTVAGVAGSEGMSDGTGGEARFRFPMGIAVDSAGFVLVADTYNNAIRRVSPVGVVTTLAGLLSQSWGYRDGAGRGARFFWPMGIAVDSSGDALVVDQQNTAIRRVTAAGEVTTVAGRPRPPDFFGNLAILDGTGSSARFETPRGIAVAPDGRVLVSDSNVVRIGKPALPDVATIDAPAGPVGGQRQLGTSPQTATSWLWEPIRIEGASTATVTPPAVWNPTFTPDVDGYFVFRLTASTGAAARISIVALAAGIVVPTATVSGQASICTGSSTVLRAELTGTPPWSLVWSDGFLQDGVLSSPATRSIGPTVSTTYSVTSVTNSHGQGSVSGSTSVLVFPPPTAVVSGGGNVCAGSPASIPVSLGGTAPFTLLWSDGFTEMGVWSFSHERTVTPTVTTTYFVTSVVDDHCSGTATGSATLTVQPLPAATVSGSTTICAGQSAELRADLTGTGPWKVTWSDGFVDSRVAASPSRHLVTPGSTTTFAVTSVTDAYCAGTGTGSATVTVLAGPAPLVEITTPSPVAQGSTGIAASVPDAGPGATYAWTITNGTIVSGLGTRTITYSVGGPGLTLLGITVASPGGCSATGTTWIWVGIDPTAPVFFSRLAGPSGGGGWFDGPGATSRFLGPSGIATDAAGNVYILDVSNNSVRKLSPAGRVSTLAGIAGSYGSAGGQGPTARFYRPEAIAATASGVIYVADKSNHTIRRVDASGVVSTFAGIPGVWGSVDGGPGEATFSYPKGVAVDGAGNVYVADTNAQTIRKVTPAGVVSTIAGMPGTPGSTDGQGNAARFRNPEGLAVGVSGNVYVADTGNHTIRMVSPTGAVTTIAGVPRAAGSQDGAAAQALFRSPEAVVVDGAGNVLVADTGNRTIRLVSTSGEVSTLAGAALSSGGEDGTGPNARFSSPTGIALETSGAFVISDSRSVRRMTSAGVVTTIAGRAAGLPGFADGPGPDARFSFPMDLVADSAGNVFVADYLNDVIRKVSPSGAASTFAGTPEVCGFVDGPVASARFCNPAGVAVDASGTLYVSDSTNNAIRKVSPEGTVTTLAGDGWGGSRDGTGPAARFSEPWGIAVDAAGNVWVADSMNHTIRRITPSGVVTTVAGAAGQQGSTDGSGNGARFYEPAGVAVDRFGNVFVADSRNGTIRKVTPGGVVTTIAGLAGYGGREDGTGGEARFGYPIGIRVDGSGNLYVADLSNSALRRVTPDGVVTTLGGSSGLGGGADGTGRAAQLGALYGVAVRYTGELVLSEASSHALWIGVPSLADAATIDSPAGSVGAVRQLGVSPSTATTWFWELVRTEAASTAVLSSTTVPNPTFTPDVPGVYRFRLTASDGVTQSITLVSLYVDTQAPTAHVSGGGTYCPGEWVSVRADFTGIPPLTVAWSDGEVWTGFSYPTGWRSFYASTSTTLSVVSVSDAAGPGVATGSAVIEVSPRTSTPVVQAPGAVGAGSPNRRASVVPPTGSTYYWSIDNGTITSGWGTNEVVFTAGGPGTLTLYVVETAAGLCASLQESATVTVLPAGSGTQFYSLAPCRVLDTRESSGPTSGGPLDGDSTTSVGVAGACGVPATARAVAANVTVTQTAAAGYLILYPANEPEPIASTVHFQAGRTRASNSQLKLSTDGFGQIAIANVSAGPTHVILDVSGYFE